MAQNIKFAEFDLGDAGFEVAPPLKAEPGTLGTGSRNQIGFGLKNRRAFKGLEAVASKTGARILFNTASKTGGLGDVGGVEAKGTLDSYIANTLWFLGFGQVFYDGVAIPGATASVTQKVLVKYEGSYTHALSGAYDAGLPQPSPPEVAIREEIGSGFTGKIDGLVSFMLASIRSYTGDRSRASFVSASIFGETKTVRFTFPEAPVGGTGWVIFAPRHGGGGTFVHYRLRAPNRFSNREFLESDIEREVVDVVTNSTETITSVKALFTSADIGKHVLLEKGASVFESVIESVTNSTTAVMADACTFTNTAVTGTFTAYVDEILRSVELEYDDTDLTAEAAWISDFQPPAAVGSFSISDVRVVCGCLSDAVNDPSVQATGTCLAVSERNYPGSYDPLKLLYLPEPFVAALGRSTDFHHYVFCRNWLGAVQYTGADIGPACTLSTIWADTGIAKAQNACLAMGRIYAFTSKGAIARLGAGEEPDTAFAEKIRPVIEDWNPEKVVTTYLPKHQAVLFAHERVALLFYLQTERWLPPIYLSDFADGEIVSAVGLADTGYITMKDGADFDLYEFDAGTGSVMTAMTNYVGTPVETRAKTIHEIAETVHLDDYAKNYYISLHRNAQRLSIDDATIAAGSNILYSAKAKFTIQDLGKFVLLFDALNSGLPMIARIGEIISDGAVALVQPVRPISGSVLNAQENVVSGHALIASEIFTRSAQRNGAQHRLGKCLNFRNCFSFAVGVSIVSVGTSATAVRLTVSGTVKTGRFGNPDR